MSLTRTCDLCGRGNEVRRFTLTRRAKGPDGIKHSQPSGGVDICQKDWERVCKPRMKAESPDWHLAGAQVCDKCGAQDKVRRYSVKKSVRTGHTVHDIAGGGLSLCHPCWESVARPRMRLLAQRQERAHLADMVSLTSGGVPRALRTSQPTRRR